MLLYAFLVFGSARSALGQTGCMSAQNKPCLPQSAMGGLASFMLGGNPCFLYNNARWCFVSTAGNMQPCTCTPQCGCGEAPVVQACDNSMVPQNPDCTSDKTTFCPIVNPYQNTMCLYCGVNVQACNKLCNRGLSQTEQQVIVDQHNALRRQIAQGLETRGVNGPQPSAADMNQLVWDSVLAASAQRWADQCPQGHDKNRNVPSFSYVGQNIADSWGSINTPDKALADKVTAWYDEVSSWPPANIGKYSSNGATGVVGHYTQLAWGPTTRVGCGFVMYMDPNQPSMPYRQTLICNYGIGGNLLGSPMYTVGAAGSLCPHGNNAGLCI